MEPRLSEKSSSTSEAEVEAFLENMDKSASPNEEVYRLVNDALAVVEKYVDEDVITGTTILVRSVLSALVDQAPCVDGQRYAVRAILHCNEYPHPQKQKSFLLTLAQMWLFHLLLPGLLFASCHM
jgi:chaperonin GroEL (HSP60 family)